MRSGRFRCCPPADRLPDFLLDGIHRPGSRVVVRSNRSRALRGLHDETIPEEVERFPAGVHHPCLLFIEHQTESVQHCFGRGPDMFLDAPCTESQSHRHSALDEHYARVHRDPFAPNIGPTNGDRGSPAVVRSPHPVVFRSFPSGLAFPP